MKSVFKSWFTKPIPLYKDADENSVADWVLGYFERGGSIGAGDIYMGDAVQASLAVTEELKSSDFDSYRGACIIPEETHLFNDDLGRKTFYLMNGFQIVSGADKPIIPISLNIMENLRSRDKINEDTYNSFKKVRELHSVIKFANLDDTEKLERKFAFASAMEEFYISVAPSEKDGKYVEKLMDISAEKEESLLCFCQKKIDFHESCAAEFREKGAKVVDDVSKELDVLNDRLKSLPKENEHKGMRSQF